MIKVRHCCTRLITYRPGWVDGSKLRVGRYEYTDVEWADYFTGRADCRAALSIAMGAPLDVIGPLGHAPNNYEPLVYEPVRAIGPDGTYYLETP